MREKIHNWICQGDCSSSETFDYHKMRKGVRANNEKKINITLSPSDRVHLWVQSLPRNTEKEDQN
jgi:hypothetical protein